MVLFLFYLCITALGHLPSLFSEGLRFLLRGLLQDNFSFRPQSVSIL